MMKKITTLLCMVVTLGLMPGLSFAQQSTDPDSVLVQPDPAQYGKPYNKVPDTRDVSFYQVNIRAFSKNGNLQGVIDRLDSIKALGVNVIYILPIYPVGILKSTNSPYCVRDYKAINKDFGTMADLRALVNGAHSRHMAIVLDWVANHTSYDNAWTKNKSWYLLDSLGHIRMPPGFDWADVAQLNYKNADMRQAMIKSMKYWVYTANVDGFRCDYADGPPADFWVQAIDTLRNIKSHKLLLLAEGTRKDLFPDGFDYNFGFNFFGNLKRVYKHDRSVKSIDSLNNTEYATATGGQQIVRYLTNHDVNSSDGTPQDLFGGQKGSMAAFVVVAYMKGIPFIYNGQEVGMKTRILFPFTRTKIDWTPNPEVTGFYKKVIAFRNQSEAIRRGELTSYSSDDVVAFTKILGGKKVLVLSNLRNKAVSYALPASLANTKWKDAFSHDKTKLGTSVNLEPYTYMVLKN